MGFGRETATELTYHTLLGSTLYAMETGEHPAVLRNMVTSPAGTTASAIYELENGKFRTVIKDVSFLLSLFAVRIVARKGGSRTCLELPTNMHVCRLFGHATDDLWRWVAKLLLWDRGGGEAWQKRGKSFTTIMATTILTRMHFLAVRWIQNLLVKAMTAKTKTLQRRAELLSFFIK